MYGTVGEASAYSRAVVREAFAFSRMMSDMHPVLDTGLRLCLMTMLVISSHCGAGHE